MSSSAARSTAVVALWPDEHRMYAVEQQQQQVEQQQQQQQ
jgi:hypothetical protein